MLNRNNSLIFEVTENSFTISLKDFFPGMYIIKPYSPPRNLEQNALLHAYLSWVAEETGNDMETLKELLKRKFASKWKYGKVKGKHTRVLVVEHTSKMTRKRFSDFFRDVELFLTEWGYPLPPKDSKEMKSLLASYPY